MADASKPGRIVFTKTLAGDRGLFRKDRAYDLQPADAARHMREGNARPAAAHEVPKVPASATATPPPATKPNRPR